MNTGEAAGKKYGDLSNKNGDIMGI